MSPGTDQGAATDRGELVVEYTITPLTGDDDGHRRDRQLAVIAALLRRAAAPKGPPADPAEKDT